MKAITITVDEELDARADGDAADLGTSEQILTTNLVIGESWTWLRRHDERIYLFVDTTSDATTTAARSMGVRWRLRRGRLHPDPRVAVRPGRSR